MASGAPSTAISAAPAQGALDFAPRPARREKPKRPPRDHAVEERVKLALELCLRARHLGIENAATWEELRQELNAEGAGKDGTLFVAHVRRLQEAQDSLLDEGKPAVGLSSVGVFWARTAAEVELSVTENDRAAKKRLTRRRRLRRVYRELLGQESHPAVEDTAA
jgi:hypothetical protein